MKKTYHKPEIALTILRPQQYLLSVSFGVIDESVDNSDKSQRKTEPPFWGDSDWGTIEDE